MYSQYPMSFDSKAYSYSIAVYHTIFPVSHDILPPLFLVSSIKGKILGSVK